MFEVPDLFGDFLFVMFRGMTAGKKIKSLYL